MNSNHTKPVFSLVQMNLIFSLVISLLLMSCGKSQQTTSLLTEEKIIQEQGTQSLLIGHYISDPIQMETTGDVQEQVFSQESWSMSLGPQQAFDAILKLPNCGSFKAEELPQILTATAQLAGYFRDSDHLLIAKLTLNLVRGSPLECYSEISRGALDQVSDTYLQLLASGLSIGIENNMTAGLQPNGNKKLYFLR